MKFIRIRPSWRGAAGPSVILLAAALALSPQLIRWANSCGHDFDFHLVSWIDALSSWRHGILYPHWAPSPNYAAGEPRFIFYPPLTWMLGAALGFLLPWKPVGMLMTFLLLAGTGLATRALGREYLSDGPATLAGCAALFSGYTLFTAYERSAFGELAGGFWIPLLLMFILRDRNPDGGLVRRSFDGSAAPLAVMLAGTWLSNAPLGVMASYLLATMALVMALQLRSWAPVVRATVAAALGLGLASIYLLPAAIEQRWVAISQAVDDPGSLIENSWLFAHHADPSLELHDLELFKVSIVGVTMIAVALAGLAVAWRRKALPKNRSWWIALAVIPVMVLILQFPISLPLWNLLPKMRYLQFPWRWLLVLEAPMGIFFALAMWMSRRWMRWTALATSALVFAAAITLSSFTFFQFCDADDSVKGTMFNYNNTVGFEGTDEYAPPGVDNSLAVAHVPDACLTTNPTVVLGHAYDDDTTPMWMEEDKVCDVVYTIPGIPARVPSEHFRAALTTPHPGYLVLGLRTYPAWNVKMNGVPANFGPPRPDGLMSIVVPAGPVTVNVDWQATRDELAGRCLSLLAFTLLAGLFYAERRLRTVKETAA